MSQVVPAIYLAFANADDNRHLSLLDKEQKDIAKALLPLRRRGTIQVVEKPRIDSKTLEDELQEWEDDLAIFHYAGHAESRRLIVHGESTRGEDPKAEEFHTAGLAGFLGEAQQLKLVFLNGCSTHDQVDELIEQGVGAVIATSVPVEDGNATKFAVAFYESMAAGRTIERAFRAARNTLRKDPSGPAVQDEPEWRGVKGLVVERGVVPATPTAAEAAPWRLYCKREKKRLLKWSLPRRFPFLPYVPIALSALPLHFVFQALSLSHSPFPADWRWSLAAAVGLSGGGLGVLSWSRLLRWSHAARYAYLGFAVLVSAAAYAWWSLGGTVVLEVSLTDNQAGWLGTLPNRTLASPFDTLVLRGAGGERLDSVCLTTKDVDADQECVSMGKAATLVYGPVGERQTKLLHVSSQPASEGTEESGSAPEPADPGGGDEATSGDTIWRPQVRIKAKDITRITAYLAGFKDSEAQSKKSAAAADLAISGFACRLPTATPTISNLLLLPRTIVRCTPGPLLWSELQASAPIPES